GRHAACAGGNGPNDRTRHSAILASGWTADGNWRAAGVCQRRRVRGRKTVDSEPAGYKGSNPRPDPAACPGHLARTAEARRDLPSKGHERAGRGVEETGIGLNWVAGDSGDLID